MALSLLLADDKPAIAKIISLSLPREEFAVESVMTGSDALAKIEAAPPNFLLIDVSLPYEQDGSSPEKDGLFLTRHIKTHPALKQIKVILLTNAFEPVDEAKCREYQADGVLIKPFDPSELRARLKSLMTPEMKQEVEAGRGAPVIPKIPTAETADFSGAISLDIGLSPPSIDVKPKAPAKPASPKGPLPDSLSPAAKELSEFFSQEIATNTGLTSKTKTGKAAESSGGIELEVPDFTRAADEWKPRHPTVDADLSQWKSRETKAPDLFEGPDAMFDTGDSSFEFSRDYLARLASRTPQPHAHGSAPALATAEHTPSGFQNFSDDEAPAPAKRASAQPVATYAAPAPAVPALSAAEMEAIVREEARRVCQDVVDKVAWEVIPELAENIIRRELDKVLASLDAEKSAD